MEFQNVWKKYEFFVKAVVELFHPFVEVAVHDLEKGQLVEIYHNLSNRKIGEPSPIQELGVETEDFPPYFSPYYKRNWDGRSLKCTSITLRSEKGKAVGLICINVDVSSFQEGYRILESFLKTKKDAENPIEIFGSASETQMTTFIQEYLQDRRLSIDHLSRSQKKEIVQELYQKGFFNFKNAAPFLAQTLSTSRASIYNYIKDCVR